VTGAPFSSVRAVLFDLDNTLLLEDEATDRAYLAAAQSRPGPDPARLARTAARLADQIFRSAPAFPYADAIGVSAGEAMWGTFAGESDGLRALREYAPGFRVEVWDAALRGVGIRSEALARELAEAFVRARTTRQLEDPAATEVLDLLRGRYRLALVTNGAPDVQRAKLAGTDLARRFDAIVVSSEVGAGKPDPRPIHAALAALEVRPEEAVMVGDSLERDIVAARAAGVYAVWLDRETPGTSGSLASEAGMRPDARIMGLRELPALLGALALRNASR